MTDNNDTLAESFVALINKSAELGAIEASEELVEVLYQVMSEIISSDLSPTRKEASLGTLTRVVELYKGKLKVRG